VFGGQVAAATKRRVEDFFDQKIHKGDWHKPLILGMEGSNLEVDKAVKFQRLSEDMKDMSFTQFRKMNRDEILAVRRVPPSRIAFFDNQRFQSSPEQAEQFRDEVITPRQSQLEYHFNRLFIALGITDWELKLPVVDLTEETASADVATKMATSQCCTRNEIRKTLKLEPLPKEQGGDEIIKPVAGAGAAGHGAPPNGPGAPVQPPGLSNTMQSLRPVAKSVDEESAIVKALQAMEQRIAKAMGD
jgi:capsid portal protein